MNIHAYVDQPSSVKQQTIYARTYERNIPSQPLQPYLDARPVLTKYSILPIVDPRKPASSFVPLTQQPTYNQERMFNPGDGAPWSGYASNVNHESSLRGQIFAIQDCPQSAYIPSSKSSLYQVKWHNNNATSVQQPFPGLFTQELPTTSAKATATANQIGYALFNNATRQQLKDT